MIKLFNFCLIYLKQCFTNSFVILLIPFASFKIDYDYQHNIIIMQHLKNTLKMGNYKKNISDTFDM